MTEELRFDGKIIGATVSRKADKWYVSVQVEFEDTDPIHSTSKLVRYEQIWIVLSKFEITD